MAIRRLVISEEFGVYRLEGDGLVVTAGTLENALLKAVQARDIEGVEIHSSFDAAQVLDSLLGERRSGEGSGLVHA